MPRSTESASELRIGELADRAGTTAPTIRYYEEIGLLPAAGRQAGGQRRYRDADVRRVTFIRRCRDVGFPIDDVRALVRLLDDPTRSCTEARDIGESQLTAVRAQLAELRALERTLAAFVDRCNAACLGGPGPDCVPLAELTRAGAKTTGAALVRGARARRDGLAMADRLTARAKERTASKHA